MSAQIAYAPTLMFATVMIINPVLVRSVQRACGKSAHTLPVAALAQQRSGSNLVVQPPIGRGSRGVD
jgi:hypothetical protein